MAFFVAAYIVLWMGLFAYLLMLAAKMRGLRDEARALAGEKEPAAAEAAQPVAPAPRAERIGRE